MQFWIKLINQAEFYLMKINLVSDNDWRASSKNWEGFLASWGQCYQKCICNEQTFLKLDPLGLHVWHIQTQTFTLSIDLHILDVPSWRHGRLFREKLKLVFSLITFFLNSNWDLHTSFRKRLPSSPFPQLFIITCICSNTANT